MIQALQLWRLAIPTLANAQQQSYLFSARPARVSTWLPTASPARELTSARPRDKLARAGRTAGLISFGCRQALRTKQQQRNLAQLEIDNFKSSISPIENLDWRDVCSVARKIQQPLASCSRLNCASEKISAVKASICASGSFQASRGNPAFTQVSSRNRSRDQWYGPGTCGSSRPRNWPRRTSNP